jgi:predicted amidohydrolase
MKIALIQMTVVNNKEENLLNAKEKIKEAAMKGSQIICLPEMFNCPYDNAFFNPFAEDDYGQTITMIQSLAKKYQLMIIAGSIPEKYENKIYNTSYIVNHEGKIISKHRKVHLFDVDVKDGIKFEESKVLAAGNQISVVSTPLVKIGVAICYDMRFPEVIRKMALEGAQIIFIPAAFNMTTGPAHWHTIAKARALDNQLYMALCSPARNMKASYTAYGHSLISNPWGEIEKELDEKESILIHDVNLKAIDSIRESLPLLKHRKPELY